MWAFIVIAVALLAATHSGALRLMSGAICIHLLGLRVATRKRELHLSNRARKKLRSLEVAFHFSRHATTPGCRTWLQDLGAERLAQRGTHQDACEGADSTPPDLSLLPEAHVLDTLGGGWLAHCLPCIRSGAQSSHEANGRG